MKEFLIIFTNLFVNLITILIFIRVIFSWIQTPGGKFKKLIFDLTEPVLAPIRKLVPPIGGAVDLSPLVLLLILTIIQEFISRL